MASSSSIRHGISLWCPQSQSLKRIPRTSVRFTIFRRAFVASSAAFSNENREFVIVATGYAARTFVEHGMADGKLCIVCKEKLKVWCRPPNAQWELGKIQSVSGDDATIFLSDGVVTVSNENILPVNPDILEGVDDLLQLSYLNEPSVLHNLRQRYASDKIYTKAGPILVAVNPFKAVFLYGNDFVSAYRQKLKDSPHAYAIADTAFNEMLRGWNPSAVQISYFAEVCKHSEWRRIICNRRQRSLFLGNL